MPDVEILDIGAIQCAPGCNVVEGDQLLYIDERHFTKLGAKRVGDRVRVSPLIFWDLLTPSQVRSAEKPFSNGLIERRTWEFHADKVESTQDLHASGSTPVLDGRYQMEDV